MTESAQNEENDDPPPDPSSQDWWFKVSGKIMKETRIHPEARYLWLVLAAYRSPKSGTAWPPISKLQQLTGFGVAKLRKATKELERMGVVVPERYRDEFGLQRGYVYQVKALDWNIGINLLPQRAPTLSRSGIQRSNLKHGNRGLNRTSEIEPRNNTNTECPLSEDKASERLRLNEQAKTLAEHYGIPESIAEGAADKLAANPKVGYPEKALPEVIRKISEDRKQSS